MLKLNVVLLLVYALKVKGGEFNISEEWENVIFLEDQTGLNSLEIRTNLTFPENETDWETSEDGKSSETWENSIFIENWTDLNSPNSQIVWNSLGDLENQSVSEEWPNHDSLENAINWNSSEESEIWSNQDTSGDWENLMSSENLTDLNSTKHWISENLPENWNPLEENIDVNDTNDNIINSLEKMNFLKYIVGSQILNSIENLTQLNYSDELEDFGLFKIIQFLKDASVFGNVVSLNCKTDLFAYLKGIMEGESWAVAMFDSMEKFPSGIIEGRRVIIGQFEECIKVAHKKFTGQHCMLEFTDKKNSTNSSLTLDNSGLKRILKNQFAYGLCVPSSCNASELNNIFKALKLHTILDFEISETSCTVGEYPEMRAEDWATICFLTFLVLLASAGTIYDMIYKSKGINDTRNIVLTSFSIIRNSKALFKIDMNSPQINAFHGLRFLSISWIVMGHYYASIYQGAVANYLDLLMKLNSVPAIPSMNSFFAVDTFFFLTGVLLCSLFFREISKNGSYDAPLALIKRYLRLTPSFSVIILIHCTIFSRFGNGPIWKTRVHVDETSCRENWWADLLYINNYASETKKCLSQSWYLCADMQMFLLSPFVLYIMLFFVDLVPIYLTFLVVGTSLITFITCYENDLAPTISFRTNPTLAKVEDREYRQFQTRMVPWLIGIATGYIICGIQAKKINLKLSKVRVVIGWLVSLSLLLGSVYGIAAFIPVGSYHSILERATYRAYSRVGWALGLSWLAIACVSGYGGPINAILSLGIFQPLSKLTYNIYLIHKSVQLYRTANTKSVKYFTDSNMVYIYMGDLMISIILSIPMYLLIEMPVTHLYKHYLSKTKIYPYPKTSALQNEKRTIEKTETFTPGIKEKIGY